MTRVIFLSIGILTGWLAPSAAPGETAEQRFKRSLQESIDQTVEPRQLAAFFVAAFALILMVAVVNRWRGRAGRRAAPRTLHSPGKLVREVSRQVQLRPAEIKQLKVLCEQQQISSPLVMLLCPSVLGKAVRENRRRIDRGVLNGLARKITRGS
ncbi:MAG: hypothetical protein NZ561_08440 [Phycisphaerae bacterium]|nr:hypothetical protein [Phycisphaerae bacterium]MDW8261060.1 hypothetical protein [Phycisphaerales bacterium]